MKFWWFYLLIKVKCVRLRLNCFGTPIPHTEVRYQYISVPDDTVLCGFEYQQYFVFYLIPYRLFYCQMVWTHGHTGWTGPGCQSYTTYLLNEFSNWELKGLKVVSYLALMGAYDRVRPQIFVYWVEWDCSESTNTDPDPTRWPRYGS